MEKFKCITFDKEAQNNLPQHIKDKMKRDREKAQSETIKKEFHCDTYHSRVLCSWFRKDKTACNSCACKINA